MREEPFRAPMAQLEYAGDHYALYDLTPDMELTPDGRDLQLHCAPLVASRAVADR
jgi:hypothetical protein